MLDFADLRRRQSELATNPVIGKLGASFAADELSLVLLQATMTVQCRLAEARRVRGLLPLTWLAWQNGEIDLVRVRHISACVDRLESPQSAAELDAKVVSYASTHSAAQVKGWLRRFVARVEPDQLSTRRKAEFKRRGVYADHDADGVSWIHALISTTDASRIDVLLSSMAKGLPAADLGTIDQRRADIFADLLLGRVDDSGASTGRTRDGAVIGVTIPITSLAGLDETPGESFDRRFTLPAEIIRELAAEPGTLFYRLLTDPLGNLLDATEIGRFPSRKLRIALDARDGLCAFPTCSVPASGCDADHVIPVPRGPTTGDNLRHLCRRHHRRGHPLHEVLGGKTFGVVDTDLDAGGHMWHLPDGSRVRSETSRPASPRRGQHVSQFEHDFASFVVKRAS